MEPGSGGELGSLRRRPSSNKPPTATWMKMFAAELAWRRVGWHPRLEANLGRPDLDTAGDATRQRPERSRKMAVRSRKGRRAAEEQRNRGEWLGEVNGEGCGGRISRRGAAGSDQARPRGDEKVDGAAKD